MPHFLSDSAFEVANGEVVDEGHLGLDPVSEGFIREAGRIEDDKFIGINDFANLHQALDQFIEGPFMLGKSCTTLHFQSIKALEQGIFLLLVLRCMDLLQFEPGRPGAAVCIANWCL